jgi:hypothetical protein
VQATEPVAVLYVPTPQGVHATPSAPVYPVRQVQIGLFAFEKVLFGHAVQFVAPADEEVFTSQDVQTTEPVAVLYVPASQGVHSVPSSPVYPAMQVQAVINVLHASEKVLAGHGVQENEPVFIWYLPALHSVQTPAPPLGLNVPARQSVQPARRRFRLYLPCGQFLQ